jgi:tRNA(fMet)-specific endonuclease VapC
MLFDTEFIIALSRGESSAARKGAERFLFENDAPLFTSRVCWAEVAEGHENPAATHGLLRGFAIVEIDEAVAWEASRIGRELKRKGLHIGDNDVWVAASAVAHGLPLVSNNAKHFKRIPSLRVLGY